MLSNKNTTLGVEERKIVEEKKKRVQSKCLAAFHLKVDHVAQGKGSTNNGPTARKLFSNPELFAGEC